MTKPNSTLMPAHMDLVLHSCKRRKIRNSIQFHTSRKERSMPKVATIVLNLRHSQLFMHCAASAFIFTASNSIVTDYASLRMTLDKKDMSPRIERWAIELMGYDYVLEHRSSTKMQHVDALSRATNILVIEDNPLELELALSQGRNPKIRELRGKLEKSEDKQYEMRNGLVYRKK